MYDTVFYRLIFGLVSLLFLLKVEAAAQSQQIDSLQALVGSSQGHKKMEGLISLIRAYAVVDNKKALVTAEHAQEFALQIGDSARFVTASRMTGQLLMRMSNNYEAEKVLLRALPIAKNNNYRDDYKIILHTLAIIYTFQARYDESLEKNFEVLVMREADQEYRDQALSLNNIGVVYFKLKNWQTALEYYNRALELKKRVNDRYDLDRLLINTGLCYNHLQNFSTALEYFDKAFDECGEKCRDEIQVEGEFGRATAYFFLEDWASTERHAKKSLQISTTTSYPIFEVENLALLAQTYIATGQKDSALVMLTQGEKVATQFGYGEVLLRVYEGFSDVYLMESAFDKASYYQQRYIALKDSIFSSELIDRLGKIQTDYAERENIKTIADKEEVIRQQQKITFAIIIIVILATLLIIVLFRSNKTKKRVNAALSEAKAIIEDQNKQLLNSNIHLNRELEERNVDLEKANESLQRVNEELDNFIYKTSHDIRGPLASLKGMCNVALIDVQDPIALSYLHKLDITADKLNTILTRLLIVNQINHSAIASDRIDFHEILNDVLLIEKKKGLPPNLSIRRNVQDDIDFYSDQEFIRLILSNLIGNAIKFYNDKDGAEPFVIISIAAFDAHIHLRVIDNGIGIKKVDRNKIFQIFSRGSERSETGGIGLYITKTAVEKLGGSIRLQTTTEGYTEFYIQLPMVTEQVPAE